MSNSNILTCSLACPHSIDTHSAGYGSTILQKLEVARRAEAASYVARVRAERPPHED